MQSVSVKEARSNLSNLIKRAEKGEEILILRRGKKVVRLVAAAGKTLAPPDLQSFRAQIKLKGKALSGTVAALRQKERF